ncbi:MAG: hypothetical protein ABSG62_19635 [Terracidiphilus sp.]
MLIAKPSRSTWFLASAALIILAAVSIPVFGQSAPSASPLSGGYVEDWSHHHLVYSNPGTEREALDHGTYARWWKIVNDPRYAMQQAKRSSGAKTLDESTIGAIKPPASAGVGGRPNALRIGHLGPEPWRGRGGLNGLHSLSGLNIDWDEPLIADGQVQPNMYPAKYSFSTTTASCTNDFVVYPTGVVGATGAATIVAYNNLYVGSTGACESTLPTVYWAYNTGTGSMVTTSPVLSLDGTKVAFIQYNGTTSSLVVVRWKASTGSLTSPATPTTVTDLATCTTPCMTVTALGSAVPDTYSSPYYAYKADDALYVGDDSSHLYKITGVFNGTTSPTVNSVSLNATAYYVASPVYDSTSGCVFVGDSEGYVYSVSSGVAGNVCTGSSFALFGHSEVLGGGANEGIFDGVLVDSTAATVYAFVTGSAAIGNCSTAGDNCIAQFATGTITNGSTSAAPVDEQPLGTGGAGYNLYDGNFDNVYYSSTNGTAGDLWVVGNTGGNGSNLYRVQINGSGLIEGPSAAITGLTDTGTGHHGGWASPVTEFCNNGASACTANGTETTAGTDYIFFSDDYLTSTTGTTCSTGASSDGCLLGYSINNPQTMVPTLVGGTPLTATGFPGCWSTGGIIVDNALTSPAQTGGSQIYVLGLNGNSPGGPTGGTYTSSECANSDTATPQAYQESQTSP